MPAIKINEYINLFFNGNKAEFARHMNVTPQQVTKWVNDEWVVSDGIVYSPKREISTGKIMNEIKFIANVICGAEYVLAEIKSLRISGSHAKERAENAIKTIDILSKIMERENYSIAMIAYNEKSSKYNLVFDYPIIELGDTYFNIMNPGSICFIYNNDIKSEKTFSINLESPRLCSGRFDNYAYAILISEVQQALQALNQQ